jgi:hypothetical protein
MENQIAKLERLATKLRGMGLVVLTTTALNFLSLIFLFMLYVLNRRTFSETSLYTYDLQRDLLLILACSFGFLIASIGSLYVFEQTKKRLEIIVGEIFDEVGWYSRDSNMDFKKNISINDRIAIKTASESASLPFLASHQSVVSYVFINLTFFFMTSFADLYLIQLLNR